MLEPMSTPLLKARVENGRLVLDEPTDLPEGEVVYLVYLDEEDDDALSAEERAELDRAIEAGLADSRAGRVVDAQVVLDGLRAKRTG